MTTPDPEPLHDDTTSVSFKVPLAVSLILALVLAGASWWVYQRLPEGAKVPVHWDAAGQVNGYGGRGSVFLFPSIVAGISLLLYFVPAIEPRRSLLLRSSKAYRLVWFSLVAFFAGVHLLSLRAALGHPVMMERWVIGGIGLLFAIIGNSFGSIRSNFVFGFRTPWTLSSELSWNRTHRLAGRLFVLAGVVLVAAAASNIRGTPMMILFGGSLTVTVLIPAVYSYLVWRSDPAKRDGAANRLG